MLTYAELHRDVWLAERLGCNVYQISIEALVNTSREIDPADLNSQLAELNTPPVFAYIKVPAEEPQHLGPLLRWGFTLVDTSLQFERAVTGSRRPRGEMNLRSAEASDEQEIAALARRSFGFSRFHADAQIPDTVAHEIKAQWTRSYFHGRRGDAMVVAVENGRIVGFLLALMTADGVMVVDLVAVDEAMRGRNVAGDMTWFAQSQFPEAGCLRVGTQLANLPAIRCYERLGFQLVRSQYVLHYHDA